MNDMHDRFRFNLVYDGPALEEHRMDVRTLAPALLALGDMVERANEILNGEQVKIACTDQNASRNQSAPIRSPPDMISERPAVTDPNLPVMTVRSRAGR